MMTAESQSVTETAGLLRESDGSVLVKGMYLNDPKSSVRGRSAMHNGGLILRVGGPPATVLEGHYWTDRNTKGEIELRFVGRKRAGDFGTARALATEAGIVSDMSALESSEALGGQDKTAGHRYFTDEDISKLHHAAIDCDLSPDALRSGLNPQFAASLSRCNKPNEQLLSDLRMFNQHNPLADGSNPMQVWLTNAAQLSTSRTEGNIFEDMLRRLKVLTASEDPGVSVKVP